MHPADRKRIEMTCRCRDADPLPRVPEAGRVETYRGERVQVLHNGVRVIAGGYQGDWMIEVIERLKGCHEPQEELALWRILPRLPQDAEHLEGYTWHRNRHTFASRLVMAGVDLRTVQQLGGWQSLAMVQRYSYLAPDHLRAAVERLVSSSDRVALGQD